MDNYLIVHSLRTINSNEYVTFIHEWLAVLEVDERGHRGDGDLGDVVDVDLQELDALPAHLLLHALQARDDLQRYLVQLLICGKLESQDSYWLKAFKLKANTHRTELQDPWCL